MCNAYTELNDPVIQRERFADQVKVSFNPNILTCINLDMPVSHFGGMQSTGAHQNSCLLCESYLGERESN